jgi:hypothetical protein
MSCHIIRLLARRASRRPGTPLERKMDAFERPNSILIIRAANYCWTSDNVRLNLANVRAKVILIGHWSDHKKIVTYILLLWQNLIANSLNLHFAIKFTRHSSILLITLRRNGYTYLSRDLYYILWRIYVQPI